MSPPDRDDFAEYSRACGLLEELDDIETEDDPQLCRDLIGVVIEKIRRLPPPDEICGLGDGGWILTTLRAYLSLGAGFDQNESWESWYLRWMEKADEVRRRPPTTPTANLRPRFVGVEFFHASGNYGLRQDQLRRDLLARGKLIVSVIPDRKLSLGGRSIICFAPSDLGMKLKPEAERQILSRWEAYCRPLRARMRQEKLALLSPAGFGGEYFQILTEDEPSWIEFLTPILSADQNYQARETEGEN